MKTISGILLLISGILLLCIISASQADAAVSEVRGVVAAFEAALEAKNLAKIESLVSAEIVVFENGYRNDGWQDFPGSPLDSGIQNTQQVRTRARSSRSM